MSSKYKFNNTYSHKLQTCAKGGNKAPFNSLKLSKIIAPLTFDDSKARKTFGWKPHPILQYFEVK